ncbi:unnamed protein product [Tenebrio molitor]|nr:unnamed protein product [Tenebrio molitor]
MNTRYLNGLAELNSHRNISDILQDVIDNVLTILMLLCFTVLTNLFMRVPPINGVIITYFVILAKYPESSSIII